MKTTYKLLHILIICCVFGLTACGVSGNSAALTATPWKLADFGSSSNPTAALPGINTTLIFGKDGKMNGNVGCNSFGGEYSIQGDRIAFGPVIHTMMACQGPVMQQEEAVIPVFSGTVKYSVESGKLIITSANGETAVTFVQAGK